MEVRLRLLQYFVAVADEGSLTRAAAVLHTSQPALSRQMSQLEQEMRVQLLVRTAQGVELTPAGRALRGRAASVLAEWADLVEAVHRAANTASTRLRVGFTSATTSAILGAATRAFTGRHPGRQVSTRQCPWRDPTGPLRSGEVDVAVLRHPIPDPGAFGHVAVHTEPRVLAMPARHRYAHRAAVDFAEVLDEVFVPLPEGPWRDHWLCLEQRDGRPPLLTDTAENLEELLAAVSAGRGVAVTAASAAEYYARPGVVYRPLRGVGPSTVFVVWRLDDTRPMVDDFVRAVASAAVHPVHPAHPDPPADRDADDRVAGTAAPHQVTVAVSGGNEIYQQRLVRTVAHHLGGAVRSMVTDSTSARIAAVGSGAADVAFARVARAPLAGLDHLLLQSTPMLLARPGRPPSPAEDATEAAIAELPLHVLRDRALAFYHREQNPWWYDEITALLADHGATPRIVHRGLWAYDLMPLVAAGTAWALVGRTTAADLVLPGIVYARLRPSPQLPLGLVWRRADRTAAVRRFVELAAAFG